MAYYYSIFGDRLRSGLELPELPVAGVGREAWSLSVSTTPPPCAPRELLGEYELTESVRARVYRIPGGYRLECDDTGSYDVLDGGQSLVWYASAGAPEALVQGDIQGRVMALALHASGSYCLHASAVAVAGRVIAFMAPKFHGKSTTAISLVRAGARLVTDDTLAVTPGAEPRVRPGIQTIRLREDSAVANQVDRCRRPLVLGKYLVGDLADHELVGGSLPLSAVYLLSPVVANEGGAAVVRTRLSATHSVFSLLGHSKLGSLLGGSESRVLLERAAALAARVPVYRLSVTRDFERLPEVTARLLEWHAHSSVQRESEVGVS
jgi:hypothetical protein